MNTATKLRSIDQLPCIAIAVEQPLMVLLESGPAFSVLVASHVSPEPGGSAIILEDCLQIRIEEDGERLSRSFAEVAFKEDPELPFWIASPDGFESLFSQPSWDPYAILQLSEEDSQRFNIDLDRSDYGSLFDLLRTRFGELPRFYTPNETRFCAPENYACGRNEFPHIKTFW